MALDDVTPKLFDKLHERNLAVWNLILNGFLELGNLEELFGLYRQMDLVFVILFVLVVMGALIDMYGKCGEVERTLECCNSLITSLLHCDITEDVFEMFGLMIDEVTLSTTLKALSVSTWVLLLMGIQDVGILNSLARVHKNEIVGKRAAKVLTDLGQEDVYFYLQVLNSYSEVGEFEASLQIREIAMARKVMREIGHSLIEVKTYC
ncbi:hypothetical protein CRYUN_Cryun06bG0122200 [Craigia yunnanensis]